MPLTAKGAKIMKSMVSQYGKKKGKQVFYASANVGKIKGVHKRKRSLDSLAKAAMDKGYSFKIKLKPKKRAEDKLRMAMSKL